MTLQQFIEKWNGKYCEVAGSSNALNQCVDLANAYLRDVLGQPIVEWTDAKDFPLKIGDLYEYILNTPTGVPKEGDLVVWTTNHIAIFLEGDVNSFRSFDQNYPTGSFCHVQNHTYSSVGGWLRFKGEAVYQVGHEVIQNSDNWIATIQRYNFSNSKDVVFAEIDKLLTYEDKLVAKDKELETYRQETQATIADLKTSVEKLSGENLSYKNEVAELVKEIDKQSLQISDLQYDIKNIENIKPITEYGKWELLTEFFKRIFT